jgi:hypothetical protein
MGGRKANADTLHASEAISFSMIPNLIFQEAK